MHIIKKHSLSLFALLLTVSFSYGQTNVCTGSYTTVTSNCQNFTIGDGTAGFIEVCLDVNNIPSGGGTSCSPGCGFTGGGFPPQIIIYDSGGNIIDQWSGAAIAGDCVLVPVIDGVADIFGLCLTAGTTISWTTVDACGNDVCSGAPPPCYPPGTCDCTNPCGPACGWATAPTVGQVTANCVEYAYLPELGPLTSSSSCYTFIATSNSVDMGVIVTSDCGVGGNVSGFTWDVYTTGNCGAAIQSGTLAGLTMSPMVIGQSYTFCYDFTTPNCTHTSHYPYFVGASALNVNLGQFSSISKLDGVELSWEVKSEIENAYFILEHSADGQTYTAIGKVEGRGTNSDDVTYKFLHDRPSQGTNYYRLSQVNNDGNKSELGISKAVFDGVIEFLPIRSQIYDLSGVLVMAVDMNGKDLETELKTLDFDSGIYIIQSTDNKGVIESFKYFKK